MYTTSRHSPPGYANVRYTADPVTPVAYSSSAKYSYAPSPQSTRGHSRRASHGPAVYSFSSPPPPSAFRQPPSSYAPAGYYTTTATSASFAPPKQPSFVSETDRLRRKAAGRSAGPNGSKHRSTQSAGHSTSKLNQSSRSRYVGDYGVYGSDEDEGYYSGKAASPQPNLDPDQYGHWVADPAGYHQVPPRQSTKTAPANSTPSKQKSSSTRPRAASYTTNTRSSQARPRAESNPKSPPKATAADAARARIPAGYSYKNWDPTEEPILLLGSVFDANSLGKWIYDWTVYHRGPATPMSDLAGDLWLLLIQLAGKIKRAEECLPRIRHPDDQDLVEDFLDAGARLWERFSKILKICEEYMWRAAQKEAKRKGSSGSAALAMGAKSGCEFVDSIFGRDRKLEETEKLMQGVRLWSMRFDVNCEDILRHPDA